MASEKLTLRLQKISASALIGTAAVLFVFALGFMTNFYQLFYDGNTEMYDFYKNLQILNNAIFKASIMLIILSVLHIPFDFHKNVVSKLGLILTGITTIVNFSNVMVIFKTNTYFENQYSKIDFSSLTDYNMSQFPFTFTKVIFSLTLVLTVMVLVLSVINYIQKARK